MPKRLLTPLTSTTALQQAYEDDFMAPTALTLPAALRDLRQHGDFGAPDLHAVLATRGGPQAVVLFPTWEYQRPVSWKYFRKLSPTRFNVPLLGTSTAAYCWRPQAVARRDIKHIDWALRAMAAGEVEEALEAAGHLAEPFGALPSPVPEDEATKRLIRRDWCDELLGLRDEIRRQAKRPRPIYLLRESWSDFMRAQFGSRFTPLGTH